MKSLRLSLRAKLITGFLVVIIIGSLIFSYVGSRIIGNILINQVQSKVYYDLETARMIYNEKLKDIKDVIKFTANREGILEACIKNDKYKLLKYLSKIKNDHQLDILNLVDNKRRVAVRVNNPSNIGDDQSENILVRKALNKEIVASTEIISRSELLKENKILADKVFMRFLPTPKALQQKEKENTDGMILVASAPIFDKESNLRGVLYGGVLLNRNYEIVDKVKSIVYKKEKYKNRDIGTSTIFQGNIRISTNVKNEQGERTIGTCVSAEVGEVVLNQGKSWIDRAFVVEDWYITGYEPIKNIRAEIIGILYVGMLEAPYMNLKRNIQYGFLGIALLIAIVLTLIAFFFTKNIVYPIKEIAIASRKISHGDLNQTIDIKSKDEIGDLADSFNQMTIALKKANEGLIHWGKTLEEKVKEKSKELETSQAQLIQSEKIATIGQLTAGIAHEINNPLGGIVVYSHLLLENPKISGNDRENLEKIVREADRCKNIVKRLLDFSRQTKPEMNFANINEILNNTLSIVEKQMLVQNIKIINFFDDKLPLIKIDISQIQQVFMNIIVNAAEAIKGYGELMIKTSLTDNKQFIEIVFTDTGCGISPDNIKKIFEPFFTTKPVGQGTGLGLAISYGIIKRHRGDIEVRSEFGKGAEFTVRLPVNLKEEE